MCLVGRDPELAALAAGLDDAGRGNGRLFLLIGEAGIGKTRLARAAAELAASRGFVAIDARGWDDAGAPAYWPFIQVIRALLRDRAGAARAALSPGDAATLAALVPELGQGNGPAPVGAGERFALFDACTRWLRDVASSQPLFITIDDLHAVDPSSLSMLAFVARQLHHCRLVLVAAYRARAARGVEVELEMARLAREGTQLWLPRLDARGVEAMIAARRSEVAPALAALVVRTSEGVPLFVEEVLRSLDSPAAAWRTGVPLPAGVRGLIQERLASLDGESRRALEIASAIGRSFTLGLVSVLAPGADVHELVERAVTADLVERHAPGRYLFTHALIRESLYRDIAGGPRARLHAAILEAFEAQQAEATLPERAHHALRAAPVIGVQRAVACALEAAAVATRAHAHEDAADLLQRALAVLDMAPADAALRAEVVALLHQARGREETTLVAPAPRAAASVAPEQVAALALSCEGDLWTVRLGPAVVRLKDSRGLQMLAQLVERPDEEIHALTLSAAAEREGPRHGDSGEVLDREAISAYRERIAEVEEEQREAEAWNDAARVERARSELELLRAELSRAVGLGDRPRRAGADAERARVNCQRRIRDAMRRIAEQDALCGRHLLRAVRTGTFCVYRPAHAR